MINPVFFASTNETLLIITYFNSCLVSLDVTLCLQYRDFKQENKIIMDLYIYEECDQEDAEVPPNGIGGTWKLPIPP